MTSPPPPSAPGGQLLTNDGTTPDKRIRCSEVPEALGGELVAKIVPCITYTIENATVNFTSKMVDALRPLLYSFLTLVIVLYGVRLMTGEQEVHRQGILLIIKVAFVIGILDMIPTYLVPSTFDVMSDAQNVVVGVLDDSSYNCFAEKGPDGSTDEWRPPSGMPVWAAMDCLLGKLFGFTVIEDGKPGMLMGASALGLMSGFLFGGAWGVVVFFGLLGVVVSIFMLVVRTIFSFLSGYLMICMMFIIAPLILPLNFLRITQSYSEAIWKNILAGFLMPIIITAYSMLALLVYDHVLFQPNSMIKSLFDWAKVDTGKLPPKQLCSRAMIGNIQNRVENAKTDVTAKPGELNKLLKNNIFALGNPGLTGGANDQCALMKVPNLNMDGFNDPKFQKGHESYTKFFEQLMTIMILCFLIYSGLGQVNQYAQRLIGSSSSVMAFNASMEFANKLNAALGSARDEAIERSKYFGNNNEPFSIKPGDATPKSSGSGQDFVTRAPGVMRASVGKFFGEISGSKN